MFLRFLLWAIVLALPAAAAAQPRLGPTDAAELGPFVDQYFRDQMAKLHVPGVAFVLVRDGRVLYAKGYGYADLERRLPVDPERTVFRVASVSKLFTATAIMQLVEEGRLDLHRDLREYGVELPARNGVSGFITLHHLLTHTGGLEERNIGMVVRSRAEVVPLEEYMARHWPIRVRAPGRRYSYANHGTALAAVVAAKQAGVPFDQLVEERLIRPLGLARTSFTRRPEWDDDFAVGYVYEGAGVFQAQPYDFILPYPSGGLHATAADIGQFMIAHLQRGRAGAVRILREETALWMQRQQFTAHPLVAGTAYGFYERFQNGQRILEHGGAIRGYSSLLVLLPEHNLGFFVVANVLKVRLGEEFVERFLERYFPLAEPPAPSAAWAGLPLARYCGSYKFDRYSPEHFEKIGGLFAQVRVVEAGPGRLRVYYPLNVFKPRELVIVVPGLFRDARTGSYAVFEEDDSGTVTFLSLGPLLSVERASWWETTVFQVVLVAGFFSVFAATVLGGAVTGLWRWARRRTWQAQPLVKLGWRLALFVAVAHLGFVVGFGIALVQMDRWEFTYGVPPAVVVLLWLPLATAPFALALSVVTCYWWGRGLGTLLGRLRFSFVVLTCLAWYVHLHWWHLLGFQYPR